jgi:hypothetical protein
MSNVIAVVNKFKELYFERRGSTAFEPYATAAKRAVLIGQILLMVGLVGMFVLILVLLAIERHLRGGTFPTSSATKPDGDLRAQRRLRCSKLHQTGFA